MGLVNINAALAARDLKRHVSTVVPPKRTQRTLRAQSFAFREYGYVHSDGDNVPPEYLIKITSVRHKCTIIGVMQEDIRTRVESRWEPLVPTSLLGLGNIILQATTAVAGITPRSLITRATTRRLWMGSSPMVLSLKLKFEAVEDAFINVVEPCRLLQSIAIPSDPSEESGNPKEAERLIKEGKYLEAVSHLPALLPPGPTPFSWGGILSGSRSFHTMSRSEIVQNVEGGDYIMVEIGRFLTFYNVIVKEVSAAHHIRFGPDGNPVGVDVNIVFETYEMMTTEGLKRSYEKFVPSGNNI